MAKLMIVLRGERLQQIRKKRGFTQEALAERLDITQQHVSKWEKGENDPSAETLVQISQALDVSIDYLLGLVDEPDAHFAPTIGSSEIKQRLLWALDKGYITEALEAFTLLTKGNNETGVPSK